MERVGTSVRGVMSHMNIMTQYLKEDLKRLMKTVCINIRSAEIMCGTGNKAESEETKMTIRELYEWALQNGYEDLTMGIEPTPHCSWIGIESAWVEERPNGTKEIMLG